MHHSEADSQPAANKSDMWTSFKVSFTALLQNKGFRVRKRNHKFHSTWNKVWGSAGSKDWQKTHDTVTLSTEKEEARSPREKIEDKNSKATYLIYSNIIFIGHYAMFSLMLQRNKLWARHCKACLSKGLCHQTEGRATSGACTRFFTAAWSSESPANDDSPRAHHKFREARIKRYNYFINFTSVNCGISHLQAHPGHPQDSGVFTGDSFQEGG